MSKIKTKKALTPEPECVEVPEKKTAVYGCSYDKKEILENRLDGVRPEGKMKYHLLLAHGGDARHMPWNPGRMAQAEHHAVGGGDPNDFSRMLMLTFSWNFDFGRKFKEGKKKLWNSDEDSGIMR